jgi:uncharacterized membrane protein YfcA
MTEILNQLLTANFALGALIVVFSGLIHGYTGFGAGLLMVPLFSVLFGPVEAIAISTIVALFGSAQLYPGAARHANWREIIPILVAVALFTPVGTYLLFNMDRDLIRRAMGGFVLLFALILMSGWVYRGKRGVGPSVVAGALAGAVSGATGVGGPPIAIYFLSSPQPPETQRGNIIISVTVLVLIVLAAIAAGGGFTIETVMRGVILTPAYIAGTWSGSRLFAIAPKEYFKRVALWLLLATGVGIMFL